VAALAAEVRKARAASPPLPLELASGAGRVPVAIVDPGVAQAGTDTREALRALGLWDTVSAKSIGVVDTADAAFLLSKGNVKLAILYASDVTGHPGFAITDTLAATDARPIVYWAAQAQHALSPNAAKFLDFLHRPEARERGKDFGLEVLP